MTHHGPLPRLAHAAWGACWGVLLATVAVATLISLRGDTQDRPHPDLLVSEYLAPYRMVPWQERYERMWFVLVCGCGAAGGWVAGRFVRPSPWLAAAAALAFVPAAEAACRGVFAGKFVTGRLFTAGAILLAPLVHRLLTRAWPGPDAESPHAPVSDRASPKSHRTRVLTGALCIPLVALVVGLLGPADVAAAASECYAEAHVGSYLVGPALYYRCPEAVPGLDFESHYGIGHAYAFSLVMGNGGLPAVLERYVLFVLAVTVLYFVSAFLVLADWLRSPWAAFAATLVLVAAAVEGLAYTMPSCWPVRYPFAFAFLFALVRGCRSAGWCAAAGVIAGLSLFWQTDVGLYTLATGVALLTADWLFLGGRATRPLLFLGTGLCAFAAGCVALFGPRVLSVAFLVRLTEPLTLYATGFGNTPMTWQPGWAYWYNLAGPGVAVASVGLLLGHRRDTHPPRAVLYAAGASLLGLAMLVKWVNRSIDIVWALNGGLVLAVAASWAWAGWRALARRLDSHARPHLGLVRRCAAGVAVLALLVVGVRADARRSRPHDLLRHTSPLVRIADRLDTYPNLLNALRSRIEPRYYGSPIDDEAVAYLRDHTRPTERVAVLSREEWKYLAAAGRAPRLYWLQLYLVHSPALLDRCADDLRRSDRVFVDRDALVSLRATHPRAHDRIAPVLEAEFEPAEESPHWTVYRRKPGATAGR